MGRINPHGRGNKKGTQRFCHCPPIQRKRGLTSKSKGKKAGLNNFFFQKEKGQVAEGKGETTTKKESKKKENLSFSNRIVWAETRGGGERGKSPNFPFRRSAQKKNSKKPQFGRNL